MPELITLTQFIGLTAAAFLVLGAFVVCYVRSCERKGLYLYLWDKPGIGKVGRSYEDVKRDENG